jgi:hypothetical protein
MSVQGQQYQAHTSTSIYREGSKKPHANRAPLVDSVHHMHKDSDSFFVNESGKMLAGSPNVAFAVGKNSDGRAEFEHSAIMKHVAQSKSPSFSGNGKDRHRDCDFAVQRDDEKMAKQEFEQFDFSDGLRQKNSFEPDRKHSKKQGNQAMTHGDKSVVKHESADSLLQRDSFDGDRDHCTKKARQADKNESSAWGKVCLQPSRNVINEGEAWMMKPKKEKDKNESVDGSSLARQQKVLLKHGYDISMWI